MPGGTGPRRHKVRPGTSCARRFFLPCSLNPLDRWSGHNDKEHPMRRLLISLLTLSLVAAACGSSSDSTDTSSATDAAVADGDFTIEIWVDNWMAVYVNGELIGEDSVSITTERSFNKEIFAFDAELPFTLAVEAKDFKETDSGLEYIGENNQQMGDGGLIAQVKDSTGTVIAVSSADWNSLVVHQAPLNIDCERDDDPNTTCEFLITETPVDWAAVDFDDSAWTAATEWSSDAVGPKDGYDEIDWDDSAELIWGSDLQVDNTVLLRTVVTG